jgi:undecaprenyl-diphosphatase
MQIWQAIILGLVEGITEYLPVSSTGHLILASHALGLHRGESAEAVKAFEVIIQAGAILAVVGLYWPRFLQMLAGLLGRSADGRRLLINLIIAFLPAAILGLLLHEQIKRHLFYVEPVAIALVLGGVYMLLVQRWKERHPEGKTIDEMTWRDALTIGLFQIVSMWPGTSRSMMTITGGYFARLTPRAAAEFSFLLGVPTLTGAAALTLYKDIRDASPENPVFYEVLGIGPTVAGLVVATISAAFAVKFLVAVLQRRGLGPFAWYRMVVGVLFLTLAYAGWLTVTAP